jgi:hypothetical protein
MVIDITPDRGVTVFLMSLNFIIKKEKKSLGTQENKKKQ